MVVNWHSKKCCYLSFCLHLPPEGVVFVPIVPLPLGDLPQSGVWHDISHRTEWWERHLVCLICKCVLLLHLIGLHITTHCASVFFFFLFSFVWICFICLCLVLICKGPQKTCFNYLHSGVSSWSFRTIFKILTSIKVSVLNQVCLNSFECSKCLKF